MKNLSLKNNKGMVLLLTFIIMTTLSAITVAFLYMTSTQLRGTAYDVASSRALWLAEAGLQKAIWYLKTPVSSGGLGENWTTAGISENFGNGSYTMTVARWDFALQANGAQASCVPDQQASKKFAALAIDNNDSTNWESKNKPAAGSPQSLIITFPYPLTINKVRFLSYVNSLPKDYTWDVSTNGSAYTTVLTKAGNLSPDVTDEFTAAANVLYLRLRITAIDGASSSARAQIRTLEAIGAKITSRGTSSVINRKIEQTLVAHDVNRTAASEIDWKEIVPAI